MVNVWRDYEVVGNFDLYAGGGIGAGGYRSVISWITGLPPTLQATTMFQNLPGRLVDLFITFHRLAVDLGYRFFSIGMTATGLSAECLLHIQQIMQLVNYF